MLRVRKGYDVDYYLDATAEGVTAAIRGQDAYYTDAVAAGEPTGIWHGRGAQALGLVGEVDPEMMKALYTHGLDPRDPATGGGGRPGEEEAALPPGPGPGGPGEGGSRDRGWGGGFRRRAPELQTRRGDLRPPAGAEPRRRPGGAGRTAGRGRAGGAAV